MDTKYRLLYFDYWIQKFLGFLILVTCATVVGFGFGIVGLIPLGAVQVLSGFIFAIGYQDRKRIIYLSIVGAFFLCWRILLEVISYDSPFNEATRFIGFVLLFIPPSLAIWYFRLTAAEYKELKVQRDFKTYTDEQILDA